MAPCCSLYVCFPPSYSFLSSDRHTFQTQTAVMCILLIVCGWRCILCVHCVCVIDLAQSGLGVVYSFPSSVEMFWQSDWPQHTQLSGRNVSVWQSDSTLALCLCVCEWVCKCVCDYLDLQMCICKQQVCVTATCTHTLSPECGFFCLCIFLCHSAYANTEGAGLLQPLTAL